MEYKSMDHVPAYLPDQSRNLPALMLFLLVVRPPSEAGIFSTNQNVPKFLRSNNSQNCTQFPYPNRGALFNLCVLRPCRIALNMRQPIRYDYTTRCLNI